MKHVALILFLLLASTVAGSQPWTPFRSVTGNIVQSNADPAVSIEVVPPATYVGAVRFELFGAADCEIHLFVDADASKNVRRLYWVQFEAYLPKFPNLKFEPHRAYSPTTLSGLPFYQRARFGQSSDVPAAGSDAERAYSLLKEKGYTLPAETVNVTYKHFLDATMRKELLFIVLEDMALSGVQFSQLVKDGALQPAWAPVAERLIDRASKAFVIKPLKSASK